MGRGLVDLAERRRGRRLCAELVELAAPVRAKLRRHAPLYEGPPHRRRIALQLGKLHGVFGGQRIRNGGEKLRHLHERSLETAESGSQFGRIGATVELPPHQPCAGDLCRNATDIGPDPRIA